MTFRNLHNKFLKWYETEYSFRNLLITENIFVKKMLQLTYSELIINRFTNPFTNWVSNTRKLDKVSTGLLIRRLLKLSPFYVKNTLIQAWKLRTTDYYDEIEQFKRINLIILDECRFWQSAIENIIKHVFIYFSYDKFIRYYYRRSI